MVMVLVVMVTGTAMVMDMVMDMEENTEAAITWKKSLVSAQFSETFSEGRDLNLIVN